MSGKCVVLSEVAKISSFAVSQQQQQQWRLSKREQREKMYAEKPTSTEIRFDPVDQFER